MCFYSFAPVSPSKCEGYGHVTMSLVGLLHPEVTWWSGNRVPDKTYLGNPRWAFGGWGRGGPRVQLQGPYLRQRPEHSRRGKSSPASSRRAEPAPWHSGVGWPSLYSRLLVCAGCCGCGCGFGFLSSSFLPSLLSSPVLSSSLLSSPSFLLLQ